ncbi:hypothetical protein ACFL0G_00100 [Candidatus Zixiibacteriota bacterium]
MAKRVRVSHRLVLLLIPLLLSFPLVSWGQFIHVSGQGEEEYTNYASELYKNYSQEVQTLKWYDDFGNYLIEGLNVFRLSQTRPGLASDDRTVVKTRYYTNYFNNLIIFQDTYKGFASSLIVGDAIRTKFTSLSMDLARFNGIRWDGATRKNKFSIVGSRISNPVGMPIDDIVRGAAAVDRPQEWPRYLFGGHWRTEVGDVLKLGATYVNLTQIKSALESKQRNFFKGDVTEAQPAAVFLRFADDSPQSDYGALIFSPPRAILTYEVDNSRATMELEAVPEEPAVYPFEVNGRNSFDFMYAIPAELKVISVDFAATVANDFKIFFNHTYAFNPLEPDSVKDTFYKLARRAAGDVHDQSNKQVVHLNYGLDTGISVYGIDFEANLFGLDIRGEYQINARHSKYPLLPGDRYTKKSDAWYLHAKRKQGPFTLGGELFRVDPEYDTALDLYSYNAINYPYSYQTTSYDTAGVHDWLVDDNDDNDRYPDGWWAWSGVDSLSYRENSREVLDLDNPKPDAGIFPGLDENNDGIPDDDQNTNGTADYLEYFMMYYRDPPRFDFGDDWNNNGTIDDREDDRDPDYIYDRDLEGRHLFLSLKPTMESAFTLGMVRQNQIAGGGQNSINYGELDYRLNFPRYGNVELFHVTKRVKDDIPDPTYQYEGEALVKDAEWIFTKDPLATKNSYVHTTYLGTEYLAIPGLKVENNLKSEVNRMRRTDFQEKSMVEYWGGVHKIDYTLKPLPKLTISPQFKYRWEWGQVDPTNGEAETWVHQYWVMPILRVDYELTPRTVFRAGLQGDPFWLNDKVFVHRFRNKLNKSKSQNARIFKIMLTNGSDYFGYKVYFNAGFEMQRISFLENEDDSEDYSRVFVRVLAGW